MSSDDSDVPATTTPEQNEKAERRKILLDKLKQRKIRQKEEHDGDDGKMPSNISGIKNKERRAKLFKKMQVEKKKKQKLERRKRKREGGERSTGNTIESMREPDQTTVTQLEDDDAEEVRQDLSTDEFSRYYNNKEYEPKVLITYSDRPSRKSRLFAREMTRFVPNSSVTLRNRMTCKKLCQSAIRDSFTDLIIIHEDKKEPNGLLVIHLPDGPTAHFKLSNVKLTSDLRKNHRSINNHRPEVILNNFTTRLGLSVGRMLGALFHYDPEFKGRRCVTFHNQRDYIFFRHHRYEFTKDGQRAKLHELGPRFTLKLRSLQEGLFDSKCGDYEWLITNKRHMMEGRRRFFL